MGFHCPAYDDCFFEFIDRAGLLAEHVWLTEGLHTLSLALAQT